MPNAGPPGTPQQPPPKRPTGASPPAGAPGSEGAPQQPKVQPPAGAPSVTGSAVPPTPHGSSHWVDITLFDGLAEAIDTNLNAAARNKASQTPQEDVNIPLAVA